MIELRNISHEYKNNNISIKVLSNINISYLDSGINVIIGNSGVGKTTLLNIIGLIECPTAGILKLNNDIIDYNKELSSLRLQNYGYIFQNHYLFPEFTVFENLCIPGLIKNNLQKNIKDRINLYLKKFQLESISNKYPDNISQGEAQRIAIIRSIMNNPKIIIADEPTSNLDEYNAQIILEFFKEIYEEFNLLFIIATHDKRFLEISNKNYKLSNKKLIKI